MLLPQEIKRQKAEQKVSTEAARQAEEESAMAERRKLEKEFQQNWEESRQGSSDPTNI